MEYGVRGAIAELADPEERATSTADGRATAAAELAVPEEHASSTADGRAIAFEKRRAIGFAERRATAAAERPRRTMLGSREVWQFTGTKSARCPCCS